MAHREPARIPGRAYRTPRQRLRISTASFIGSREGLSRVRIVARSLSEVVFATSHPQPCRIGKPARIPGRAYRTPRQRLRISTASFIGSREGLSRVRIVARSLSEVVFATSHPQPCRIGKPARIPGRAYRTPRQRLRISTASLSDVANGCPGSGSWLDPYRKSSSRLRIRSHGASGSPPAYRGALIGRRAAARSTASMAGSFRPASHPAP